MEQVKKKVKLSLVRECIYDVEVEMTEEEYKNAKRFVGVHEFGADVLETFGKSALSEPDSYVDEVIMESEWDEKTE